MQKRLKGTYTKECRLEAVKLILDDGLSWREVTQRLVLSPKTPENWVAATQKGKLQGIGPVHRSHSEVESRLVQHGAHVGAHRIKRTRRKLGRRGGQRRRCQATTDHRPPIPGSAYR